jgi:hypothetical protein
VPSEIRHLLFHESEVVSALAEFHRRAKDPLPSGTVARFALFDQPSVRVEIEIVRDETGEKRKPIVVEKERLAAALILHCKAKKIPLPASAIKVLRIAQNQLALVVTIGATPEEADKLGRTI